MPRVREAVSRQAGSQTSQVDGAGLEAIVAEAKHSNARLLDALDTLQRHERINDKLVIGRAMTALRRCAEADGLSPSARQEVRAAYKMCRAAMGLSA